MPSNLSTSTTPASLTLPMQKLRRVYRALVIQALEERRWNFCMVDFATQNPTPMMQKLNGLLERELNPGASISPRLKAQLIKELTEPFSVRLKQLVSSHTCFENLRLRSLLIEEVLGSLTFAPRWGGPR